MRSKFAASFVLVASLLGATVIASAQTQPAAGASSEGNVGPGATKPMKQVKPGMTTGSGMNNAGSNRGDARNPSGQGNVGPGTDNKAGPNSGGK
jgi:hypothetical protein